MGLKKWFWLLIPLTGCISPESPLIEAGGLCADVDETELDAKVKVFIDASEDFDRLAGEVKGDVKTACANVALDLGGTNSWDAISSPEDAIWNESGTGACNVAEQRIAAIMDAHPNLTFALSVTRGACHIDFEAQKACEDTCDVEQACEPGTVETRCEPGEMSMICETECSASSWCEGTPENACDCTGRCEANCVGQCDGECIAADGSSTMNDPNCRGKCTSSCHGACEGACQLEQAQSCGAEVRCRGECTAEYSDPQCESIIGPPDCTSNMQCHEACSARACANPICEPPRVELLCDSSGSDDIRKLVDTINANFSKLWELAETKGPLVAEAVDRLAVTGQAVVDAAGDLSGKNLACAKEATKAAQSASIVLRIATRAGTDVTNAAKSRSK